MHVPVWVAAGLGGQGEWTANDFVGQHGDGLKLIFHDNDDSRSGDGHTINCRYPPEIKHLRLKWQAEG